MLTYYQSERLELRILKPDSSSAVLDFYERNRNTLEPVEPLRPQYFTPLPINPAILLGNTMLSLSQNIFVTGCFEKTAISRLAVSAFPNFRAEPFIDA